MASRCRLCLCDSETLINVSEHREGLPISVLVMVICPVKIQEEDLLPKQICDECLEVVVNAHKLRETSSTNERYLKDCVETTEVATIEEEEEDGEEVSSIIEEEYYAIEQEDEEEDVIEFDPTVTNYKVDCVRKGLKSAVWGFFGLLVDQDGNAVESIKNFYCRICVEDHQCLTPKYKAESSTSILFAHLKKVHDINRNDIPETSDTSNGNSHLIEIVACTICNESFTQGSIDIHKAIEHPNGCEKRVYENTSQYTVNCFKKSSKSLSWDYFGALVDEQNQQIDEYHFYCRLCVEEENKLSPKYTKNTSTSILLQHLKNSHTPKPTPSEPYAKRKLPEPIMSSDDSKRLKIELIKDDSNGKSLYSCDVCGEEEESKKALNRHRSTVHGIKEPRNSVCGECQKSFSTNDMLTKHIKNVHNSSKFQCNRCPTILSSAASLKRHLNCHLQLKRFSCQHCSATYTEAKTLKLHVQKVHEGIQKKPFACELCDQKFSNSWLLSRHQRTHTGEVSRKRH